MYVVPGQGGNGWKTHSSLGFLSALGALLKCEYPRGYYQPLAMDDPIAGCHRGGIVENQTITGSQPLEFTSSGKPLKVSFSTRSLLVPEKKTRLSF
jgi:hypothetical protein